MYPTARFTEEYLRTALQSFKTSVAVELPPAVEFSTRVK
jgi:hypothetical protein